MQLAFCLCRIFLSSLTLCNISSFHTHLVQLIFSILLQHHISKLPRYFRSIFQSVQISALYKDKLQMWHFSSFILNLSLICCKVELLLSQTLEEYPSHLVFFLYIYRGALHTSMKHCMHVYFLATVNCKSVVKINL